MAQDTPPPGIIDTLTAGFSSINRIFWVLAIPVLVDLFLWQGPRLSAAPVIEQFRDWYSTQASITASTGGTALVANQEQVHQVLSEAASSLNVFALAVISVPIVPSFIAGQSFARPAVAEINTTSSFMLAALVLFLVGLLVASGYLAIIAGQVRGEVPDGRLLALRTARNWLNFVALVVMAALLSVGVIVPVSIIVSIVLLVSQALGAALLFIVMAVMMVAVYAAIIYLFFLVDAVVVSDLGPLRAARNSVLVVNRNFWSAVGLMLLTFLIMAGTQIIWAALAKQPLGLGPVPGILGNAYIASGLSAASMLFYRDRLALLERIDRKSNGRTDSQPV